MISVVNRPGTQNQFVSSLIFSSGVSVFLFFIGAAFYGASWLWFLNWNLFLAWLPLLFTWLLVRYLKKGRWLSWQGIGLTALWLGFLPNSFYIFSDLIHLQYTDSANSLFYAVLILSFALSGFLVGYTSLYIVHKQLLKRMDRLQAHGLIGLVLLACSFAIYLGRYLRWNTWDVLINPAGILFDVTDRIINPEAHEVTFRITFLIFILLASLYIVIWQMIAASKDKNFGD